MKVTWPSQTNPTNLADAVEKSIAKWHYFSYCTKKSISNNKHPAGRCGLCFFFNDLNGCGDCILKGRHVCGKDGLISRVQDAITDGTMKEVHIAARRVRDYLKEFRNI